MMSMFKNFFKQHGLGSKVGFGITEVLIAAAILGFMCVALNKLQAGNHETFLRLRGRDAAIEVAQRVLDSLKSVGCESIPANTDPEKKLDVTLGDVERSWARGLGGTATIKYTPKFTVFPTKDYRTNSESSLATISHVYAKQVEVTVYWNFKGSEQSVSMSGVIR